MKKKLNQVVVLIFNLLGIGANGHIGFNEPGSNLNSITRLVKLDYKTRKDARFDFNGIKNVPTSAITMGVKTILSSKRIILLAWGHGKSESVKTAVEFRQNVKVPASLLQSHDNTTFVLDKDSSSNLTRISQPWQVGAQLIEGEMKTKSYSLAIKCHKKTNS